MMRLCLILICLLPLSLMGADDDYAATSPKWDTDYIETLFQGRQISDIEGVWKFPGHGAKIAIVRSKPETYNIYIIDSPQLDVRPGTLIGEAIETGVVGTYDGTLKSKSLGLKHKLKSQSVVFEANKNGRLIIKPYKTGYSVTFKRWISYFFRLGIEDNTNKRPNNLDGAHRIYPVIINDQLPIAL